MFYRILSLATFTLLLQGCIIEGVGLLKYPSAWVDLEPEEAKFFKYNSKLSVNGSVYYFENIWHCQQIMYFTAMDMEWHLKWVPSQKVFVREFDQKSAVYFELPENCDGNIQLNNDSIIGYMKDASDLELIKVISYESEGQPTPIRILSQSVNQITSASQEAPMTDSEKSIFRKIKQFRYKTILAIGFPKEDWSKQNTLRQTISKLDSISLSSETHPNTRGYTPWFPGYLKFVHLEHTRKDTYLTFEKDSWVFREGNDIGYYKNTHEASIYKNIPTDTIWYGNKQFSIKSGSQLYDPATEYLYTFVEVSL